MIGIFDIYLRVFDNIQGGQFVRGHTPGHTAIELRKENICTVSSTLKTCTAAHMLCMNKGQHGWV